MLIQRCNKHTFTLQGDWSASDATALQGLMLGQVTQYKSSSTGGTDCPTPSPLRHRKFGVSKKYSGLSCTLNVKHLKASKKETDLMADVALFDADYTSTVSANSMRLIYGGAR